MTPERWSEVRKIFDAAIEYEPGARHAFLDRACTGDAALRREVESLLTSHFEAGEFLARPVASVATGFDTDDSIDRLEGWRIGPYQLQHCIGRGGMGSVWLAHRVDNEYKQSVAIKMVRRGMDSREILRRFRLERQVLAGLDHPNIARLLGGGSTPDGLPYLIMEYVEGRTIDRYCDLAKITITQRLQLFRSVCSAVAYAHRSLVVHRDIKHANVLVTIDGVPKLLDFGIAKLLPGGTASGYETAAPTRLDRRPMTVEYASPEQVRGEPITTATDVYSLGVMLYRLLTGRSPYELQSRTQAELERSICEQEPKRPSAVVLTNVKSAIPDATQIDAAGETRDRARKRLRKKLAGDLDVIILKALRKEPERRYASVEQFSEDIRRYLEGLPVLARGDTLGYRAAKFFRRNLAGTVAIAAILLALIGSTIAAATYARRAAEERTRAERRFQEAHEFAEFLLSRLDPAIQPNVPPARQMLVSQGTDYLDRLRNEAGDDVVLNRRIMQGYWRVAMLESDVAPGAAKECDQKAFDIAQSIARARPVDETAQHDFAQARLSLAEAQLRTRDDRSAIENLRRYVQSAPPAEAAPAYDRLGAALEGVGAHEEALAAFGQAVALSQQVFDAHPDDRGLRATLVAAQTHLAEALGHAGRASQAVDMYHRSINLLEAQWNEDPSNRQSRLDLAAALAGLSCTLTQADREKAARPVKERALDLLAPLHGDPQAGQIADRLHRDAP